MKKKKIFSSIFTLNIRKWHASETWANITSGNYYFYFSKSNDGYWITGTGVELSSSN